MIRLVTKCRGCGIPLQHEDPIKLGYVPPVNPKKSRKKRRICQRCWYLQYYNKEPPQLEQNENIKYQCGLSGDIVGSYLQQILPQNKCVVLHMVDVNDLSRDSFLPKLDSSLLIKFLSKRNTNLSNYLFFQVLTKLLVRTLCLSLERKLICLVRNGNLIDFDLGFTNAPKSFRKCEMVFTH